MAGDDLPKMPLIDHLRELRKRLIISVTALLVGLVASLPLSRRVIGGLKEMCHVCNFQVVDPTEGIVTYFRVSLVLGLVLAIPVILYQLVAFVLPALRRPEKRYLYLLLPGAALMFALGLAFGYFVVLPRSVNFLAEFMVDYADPNWRLLNYIAFVTNMLLVAGLTFETPLVVFVLAKIGILSPAFMTHYRRHAIVILAVLAAVLTPTPDPFTMFIVLVPMVMLYELGILLARFA